MSVNSISEVSLAFDRALSSAGLGERDIAFDKLTMRRFDIDGRMHVDRCNISKANVCPYFGREIPNAEALRLEPNRIYKLYRDPEELRRAAPTFARLQLLMLHAGVNAADPKTSITVGAIGSDVEFNAPYLTASIAVWTAEGIKLIESKKQAQLSSSYRYRADMTPGVSPDGVQYDGVMRDIIGNHVALVETGRAGPDVYVSDSNPLEFSKMKRAALVNAVAAALGESVSITEEQRLAVDAALDAAMVEAEEAEDEDLEEDPDVVHAKKKARDKKKAKDSKPVKPGPTMGARGAALGAADAAAMDEAIESAIAAKGYITSDAATKLANDAAASAVAAVNALHRAREEVKPLVGIVAMDSAEAVYRFALTQEKVAHDGIPAVALAALVEQVKQRKAGAPTPAVTPKLAADAASLVSSAIPGLGRFQAA